MYESILALPDICYTSILYNIFMLYLFLQASSMQQYMVIVDGFHGLQKDG